VGVGVGVEVGVGVGVAELPPPAVPDGLSSSSMYPYSDLAPQVSSVQPGQGSSHFPVSTWTESSGM
jgi:hypothetical protein